MTYATQEMLLEVELAGRWAVRLDGLEDLDGLGDDLRDRLC
jgi:hypothetical protein